MHLLTAPVLAATALLALAGVQKLARPAGASQALRTQGLPSAAVLVRLLGAVEIGLAIAVLAQAPASTAALAAAYAGFTAFVVAALLRGRPLSSCGCFSEPDTPPTRWHVVVTATFAVLAAATAGGAPAGLPALLDEPATTAVATVLSAAVVAGLAYLVLADLPRLQAAATRPEEQPEGPQLFTILPVRSAAS